MFYTPICILNVKQFLINYLAKCKRLHLFVYRICKNEC